MTESRTQNTKRNMISGLIKQIVGIIFPFIIRTLILYQLGEEYQGLSGLFTSVLSVLNLSDLGFSSAVVYILYKPIAEQDHKTVCEIMSYLKKVYRIIGFVILGIGIVILPFLPHLIKGTYPSEINIYFLYLIYLSNSVISYWLFAYKSALLTAMQRMDICDNIYTVTKIFIYIIQITVLILIKNFYAYIIFLPISTAINNILIEFFSNKYFPQIVPNGIIKSEIKAGLIKQVKGVFINRIGDVARNGADNIVISSMIGLAAVAVYNNYFYIYSALYGISLVLSNSMGASVGNSIVKESVEKNYNDMCKFTFIFSWFTGWCTICMCCLYQPFMKLWMRGNISLMLPNRDMVLFCIYFYAITMNNIRNQYLSGAGLFWELRLWYMLEAVGNIALNLIFGYLFGITGILLATLITIILFNFIAQNIVLFKLYLKKGAKAFYIQHITYIAVTLLVCFVTYFICSFVVFNGILGLMVKAVICIFVPNILFLAIYFRTKHFHEALFVFKNILFKKINF